MHFAFVSRQKHETQADEEYFSDKFTGDFKLMVPCIMNEKVQLDATVCRHLFTAKSRYMFRVSQHPSSGALKTVTATSSIGHNTGTATSFQRGLISPDQTTLEGSSCTSVINYTRGSGYSF